MESRGEVKVFPTTDDPQRFKKLKKVFLDTGREKMPLEVAGARFFKNLVIVKFKGIDNINEIEKYRQCALLVDQGRGGRSSRKMNILLRIFWGWKSMQTENILAI